MLDCARPIELGECRTDCFKNRPDMLVIALCSRVARTSFERYPHLFACIMEQDRSEIYDLNVTPMGSL